MSGGLQPVFEVPAPKPVWPTAGAAAVNPDSTGSLWSAAGTSASPVSGTEIEYAERMKERRRGGGNGGLRSSDCLETFSLGT